MSAREARRCIFERRGAIGAAECAGESHEVAVWERKRRMSGESEGFEEGERNGFQKLGGGERGGCRIMGKVEEKWGKVNSNWRGVF